MGLRKRGDVVAVPVVVTAAAAAKGSANAAALSPAIPIAASSPLIRAARTALHCTAAASSLGLASEQCGGEEDAGRKNNGLVVVGGAWRPRRKKNPKNRKERSKRGDRAGQSILLVFLLCPGVGVEWSGWMDGLAEGQRKKRPVDGGTNRTVQLGG
jgi:hypothetical protein